FFLSGVVFAQVTTGTVSGTVSDSTGAVIPGANVTLRNVETGITRTTMTDAAGRYRVPQLGLGSYEVTAEAAGFQTSVRTGITLTVGREATVDFSMQIGAVAERITVTGEAPLIETTSATVASLVSEREVRDLPLSGRSFADLTAIQPGVVSDLGVGQSVNNGVGTRVSINGARPQQSSYLMDGIDIVSPAYNIPPASVLGQLLGVETVREFNLLANNYGAQYGRASGGVINAVTRSGTNELHGSAFEFLRNEKMDAKNYFAPAGPIPTYKRNQFGAAAGGPIVKDKTFFFLAYEGVRERIGTNDVGFVPTSLARQGILPGSAPIPVKNAGSIAVLNLMPCPDSKTGNFSPPMVSVPGLRPCPDVDPDKDRGGGIGTYTGTRTQQGTEDYGMIRIDQQFTDKDSIFGRLTVDNSASQVPLVQLVPGGMQSVSEGGYRFAALEYTRLVSPSIVNIARTGFTRNNTRFEEVYSISDLAPELSSLPGRPLLSGIGASGVSVPGGLGTQLCSPIQWLDNTFDHSDSLLYNPGAHAFAFGVNVRRYQMNEIPGCWFTGSMRFTNLASLLSGNPNNYTFTRDLAGGLADLYRGWRQTYVAAFIQDDFTWRPNLTVNLGLRWETVSNPSEVNNKVANVVDIFRDRGYTQGKFMDIRDSLKGLSPRVGLAWSPFHDQKTVVRAGFGIFKEPPLVYMYQLAVYVPPWAERLSIPSPTWPFPLKSPILAAGNVPGDPVIAALDFKTPYSLQYNFGIERQIGETLTAEVTYVGTRGLDLANVYDPLQPKPELVNGRLSIPKNAPFTNPSFTASRYTANVGDAWYNGLQLVLKKRFGAGLGFNSSYTFAKNMGTTGIGLRSAENPSGTNYLPLNSWDIASEKGLAAIDTRHNFRFSFSYELPFGAGQKFAGNLSRLPNALLGGWQINSIISARGGLPATLKLSYNNSNTRPASGIFDRPDLKPGASNNPVLGGPDRYYDVNAFLAPPPDTFGNLGQNTLIGPSLFNLDFSLFKEVGLGETKKVQFRAEFFNLFNHPNFSQPNTTVFTSPTRINPTAGRISGTITDPRKIQLALKFEF
ncbi:MAG: TonB-dependent receptor, partial [Acidobacteria bacterium]|nr:TonB-dependent receptor [Acidobacteriota bacterium]